MVEEKEFCALDYMENDNIADQIEASLGFWGGVSVAFMAGVVMYFALQTFIPAGGAY